ncbi:fatty acid desaturase [Segnochrobactrum spirostomi]|uniref:Fatty acid desaturase n=1 Tax=Segnochrobactrum spirostomi TaxID=2608987 RepID=A0A6A7Y7A3_9HYPH|nr:fatty acid desaturase [Segnochrobactrum spirostomi]MQT13542.1 fatty acid desaturase [Segnochrobactrum spirostomi]
MRPLRSAVPARITAPGQTVEWQTIALAAVIYGGWLALTWFWSAIPIWLLVPLAAWLIAWQGSLQHEVMHGHPTRNRRVNDAIGWPPLSLWLPYPIYRVSHLRHHRDEYLTDPIEDPESTYLTAATWRKVGPVGRAVLRFNMTLAGRLVVGSLLMIGLFLYEELRRLPREPRQRRIWARHAVGVAAVLVWVVAICGMPLWLYLVAFVWAGAALTRLRSFAEHRWAADPAGRTAIVENGGLFGLLYLNNNLHVLHHLRPRVPWYRLPKLYRRTRKILVARNGGLVYRGYGDIARRFLLRMHDDPLHPPEKAAAPN